MSRDYMGKAEFDGEAKAASKAEHTPGPWEFHEDEMASSRPMGSRSAMF
jgi:hypothetical protein